MKYLLISVVRLFILFVGCAMVGYAVQGQPSRWTIGGGRKGPLPSS